MRHHARRGTPSLARRSSPGRYLLAALLLCGPAATWADEPQAEEQGGRPFALAPDPAQAPGPDADLFARAVALQAKGRYRSARRVFWKLIDEFPDSPFAPEAEDRSGPNAFLGIRPMGATGPSERRIDVAFMGDGYRLDKQKKYDKHCEGQLRVLLGETLYEVYRPYFNFWQFNLASEDKGVDEPDPPAPDEEFEARRRKRPTRRKKRGPRRYNTALDCMAAGPQGQVWANPRRVWHYLQYLREHDSLAICFAQMGRLGMGGMGIATTGPRGVVVHEFGHAFVGLLDEYANNPGPPMGVFSAPNAATTPERPPWQHFLDARYPGVGVYEGGATFQKGVWRPAPGCAMNSGGGSPYCPVCREAGVLAIYQRVSPIDAAWPEATRLTWVQGAEDVPTFSVLPMAPVGHDLKVKWILGPAPEEAPPAPEPPAYDPEEDEEGLDPFEVRLRRKWRAKRGASEQPGRLPTPIGRRPGLKMRALGTAHDPLPKGKVIRGRKRHEKGVGDVHSALLPELAVGRYQLTAIVWDPARPKGATRPWVLKDERGLLEARRAWIIRVTAGDAPK